jgi:hypothetical protein
MIAFVSVMIRRLSGLPGLPIILVWAIGVAYLSNNHTIRTIDLNGLTGPVRFGDADEKVKTRRHLRVAIDDWANACRRKIADKDSKGAPSTIVLVATAGGASRAALWTASVLHQAEEVVGEQTFRKALFAISGVSGGSLGAAAYIASLPPDGCDAAPDIEGDKARWLRTRSALSENFLAPPVTAYLSTDLFARVLPFEISDRAAALEQSWEVAFKTAWAKPLRDSQGHDLKPAGELEKSFLNIWPQPGDANGIRLPLLFLNGTHANTGLPLMTSPVKVTRDQFPLALDLLDITGRDVRLSTAVLNSARFPVVTPGGTLMDRHQDGPGYGGYVMDGGYVENFGADTVRDIAADLATWSEQFPKEKQPHVLVIQISSDPSVDKDVVPRCGARPDDVLPVGSINKPPQALSDVFGPLIAVVDARGARGARTAGDLMRAKCPLVELPGVEQGVAPAKVNPAPIEYVHFALCNDKIAGKNAEDVVGLNWALTDDGVTFLATSISASKPGDPSAMAACGNDEQLKILKDWFSRY